MASTMAANPGEAKATSSMDSSFPILLPEMPEIFMSVSEFDKHIQSLVPGDVKTAEAMAKLNVEDKSSEESTFMDALHNAKHIPKEVYRRDLGANLTLTDNDAVALKSTNSALVDLFNDLGSVKGSSLNTLLSKAWEEDALCTLKLIFNARSIHLGKGNQKAFYQSLGWLKENHPRTLLVNIEWLYRPTIAKKIPKENPAEEDKMQLVDMEGNDEIDHDLEYGVSHGYWKDILNVLVLAAEDSLKVETDENNKTDEDSSPQSKRQGKRKHHKRSGREFFQEREPGFFDQDEPGTKRVKTEETIKQEAAEPKSKDQSAKEKSKALKHKLEKERHDKVLSLLATDPFYKALHIIVARSFAQQLTKDLAILNKLNVSGKELTKISLAAKWAPSLEGHHDARTNIATTIAEIMFPRSEADKEDRERYLKRAREDYRRLIISPLRKSLAVVERDITAGTFNKIQYEKVPSKAMDKYKRLFVTKDEEHFISYLSKVAAGKTRISGAVLTPAGLVKQGMSATKSDPVMNRVLDAQWKSLVQRVRENGKLSSSIAVCDVSGSMMQPTHSDNTNPMHSAVGLSLLIAEIVEPPFGGSFITFSSDPRVEKAGGPDDKRTFVEKVHAMQKVNWGLNTDFLAVFERLILPMAVDEKLKPEQMVKQIFVFSDMQFDQAQLQHVHDKREVWNETSHARVKRKFKEHGYELPTLVYWDLAGDRVSNSKNVEHNEIGVMMVSGYSQSMIKMFLEGGTFGGEEEIEVAEDKDEDGDFDVVKVEKTKKQATPFEGMMKAIGHKAYSMLKVVD